MAVPRRLGRPAGVRLDTVRAAPELVAAIGDWLGWLAEGRRLSPHTVSAYRRDVTIFCDFLGRHFGGLPGLSDLDRLLRADP